MSKELAVLLSSGGLNSAVMTSIAADEYDLAMLHVRFAHRAEDLEAELFEKQADYFGAKERLVVELPHFGQIGGNGRVNHRLSIEIATTMGQGESNCHVPGLIGALAQVAFTWANQLRAEKVFLGVSENLGASGPRTDAVFPDYSRDFVLLCQHQYAVASPTRTITIETPLIDLNRTDIVRLGHRLNTPFEMTWSCIGSGEKPCGLCLGCVTRNRGFLDAAIPDPIMLQPAAAGA